MLYAESVRYIKSSDVVTAFEKWYIFRLSTSGQPSLVDVPQGQDGACNQICYNSI